jgi:FkbM family methyltransferase
MSMIRNLVERLSRDRVLKRRLPAALGGHTLWVSPDAAARFWRRDLVAVDPLLVRLARELVQPGAVVWDVGANVGLFAVVASHAAGAGGKVLAVEADGWLATLLRRSAATLPAGHAPIDVLSAAVADRQGIADFHVVARGRAANHLASVAGSSQAGGTRSVQKVVTVTLDGLLDAFPAPALVKVDVESAELACLRGAARLLAQVRPTLLCEVGAGTAAQVAQVLASHGYTLYDAELPPGARQPVTSPAWNTLALPPGAPAAGAR